MVYPWTEQQLSQYVDPSIRPSSECLSLAYVASYNGKGT